MAVGYSGLKDRHAVTRQYFTVHLPGRADPDWSSLALDGVAILEATRHNRKLKRGSHRANAFVIRLRDMHGDRAEAERRIATIRKHGVPNYFGEQRFGHDGGNIALAQSLFRGRRMGRAQRGIALSAARSAIFNAVLARRVREKSWERALTGEVWMLSASNAIFGPVPLDAEIVARHAAQDIQATGPLWGAGALRSEDAVLALESEVVEQWCELADGLVATDLKQERRRLCLSVPDLSAAWPEATTMELTFPLPSGTYATSVLAELCDWRAEAPHPR